MEELFYEVKEERRNLFYKIYIHKIGPFRFNWHKEVEVNIILRGKVEVCVEGNKYFLNEDDIIIINSNSGHATLAKEPGSIALVFHLDPIYFKDYFKEYESIKFRNIISLTSIDAEKYNVIKYLLASLIEELREHVQESKMICDAIVPLFVANLIKIAEPSVEKIDKVKNSKKQMEVMTKLLKYIEEMYKEKITLNKIADILGYNPCYVSQFFKSNIGVNYYEYLTRIRVREATFELARSERAISEIALEYGFSDIKSFNKSFREIFGRSPNQYKLEVQQRDTDNQFFLKRVFVLGNDEYVNTKLKEYKNILKDNILLMNHSMIKQESPLQQQRDIIGYQNKIKQLEKRIEEQKHKIQQIKSILE